MNCSTIKHKDKDVKATKGFAYTRKGRGKYLLCCDECQPEQAQKLENQGIQFTTGNLCPFCNGTGTNRAFMHVQGGICFRCDGKGHW